MIGKHVQVDQSIVRQNGEEDEFNHYFSYPFGIEWCTSADSVRKHRGLSPNMDFRIVVQEESRVAMVFVREEDWRRMQEEEKKEQAAARRQRAMSELKHLPVAFMKVFCVACLAGLIWVGLFALVGTVSNFSFNLWQVFIWPATIVGAIALLKCTWQARSNIFNDDFKG